MAILRFAFLLAVLLFSACSFKQRELGNVYRAALPIDVKGFDPAQADDLYSNIAIRQIYETLLQYHPYKRPYELMPLLADSLPQVSQDRMSYRFRVKKGVYFQPDPCFRGKSRELTANDFVFAIKRLADIRVKSSGWWIFEGRIEGLDEFRTASTQGHRTNYNLPVSGLSTPDPYTLVVKLKSACPQLPYLFAMPFTVAVAREAVEFYGEEFLNHPVGTGPFIMADWRRQLRITYVRSPSYRGELFPCEGSPGDSEAGLLADCGRRLPLIDTLFLNIFQEDMPMWLTFLRQGIDGAWIPKDNYDKTVKTDLTLRPELASKGIVLNREPSLDVTYTSFNMEDSLLGTNVHLRRAMCFATNTRRTIDLLYNGRAILSHSPVPPGLLGYDSAFRNPYQCYDTAKAGLELAAAGYPKGRGLPEFAYLELDNTISRQWSEKFVKEMADVGIRIKVDAVTWPEYLKRLRTKRYQISGAAWGADYPDPENFLQLLYGPNEAPGANNANFKNAEYDSLYRALLNAPDDSVRLPMIRRMKAIFVEQCPWIPGTHRLSVGLRYDWVRNYKFNDIAAGEYKYISADTLLRNRRIRGEWK